MLSTTLFKHHFSLPDLRPTPTLFRHATLAAGDRDPPVLSSAVFFMLSVSKWVAPTSGCFVMEVHTKNI
jgi:hypothetical protein